jgi:predicted Zn-dependent protease
MRHRLVLATLTVLLVAAIAGAQRRKVDAPASAQSILYLIADGERELTRLPAKFTVMSDNAEISAGDAIASQFEAVDPNPSSDDREIQRYVESVGRRVASRTERKLPYRFHYIADRDFINAFALPGGHVFIGAGLIERMDTEDELAAVLAHELEHIDHRHCAERYQLQNALDEGSPLAIPVAVFEAGYSKSEELEADREGLLLAARAGYSPNGTLQILRTLDRLSHDITVADRTPQGELTRVATEILNGYFASHPPTSERIAQAQSLIARHPSMSSHGERALTIQYIMLARRAQVALAAGRFDEAALLASQSQRSKPDNPLALMMLAEANYGRGSMTEAQSACRKLLEVDALSAAAVQRWLLERSVEQIDHDHAAEAAAALAAFLGVYPNEPNALRALTIARAMLADRSRAIAAASTLRHLYPQVATELAADTGNRAVRLLEQNHFDQASVMASACFELQPKTPRCAATAGAAEFAQAHFAEAARAYDRALDLETNDLQLVKSFADAASVSDRVTAAARLDCFAALSKLPPAALRTEIAGLRLIDDDDEDAQAILRDAEAQTIPPELLARLGWWYFRAGRAGDAERILRKALAMRPSDSEIQNNLAWSALAAKGGASAVTLTSSVPDTNLKNSDQARTAISEWLRGQPAVAIDLWRSVIQHDPQWANDLWVTSVYPRPIADAAKGLETERIRIAEARNAEFNRWLLASKAARRRR